MISEMIRAGRFLIPITIFFLVATGAFLLLLAFLDFKNKRALYYPVGVEGIILGSIYLGMGIVLFLVRCGAIG